jgi:hypothetical protein
MSFINLLIAFTTIPIEYLCLFYLIYEIPQLIFFRKRSLQYNVWSSSLFALLLLLGLLKYSLKVSWFDFNFNLIIYLLISLIFSIFYVKLKKKNPKVNK